jgi:hypothetical protein
MTQLAEPFSPERDPGISPQAGLSLSERLGDLSILAKPAQDFGALPFVEVGGGIDSIGAEKGRLQDQISKDLGHHDTSKDELYMMGLAQEAHVAENTQVLHAMSRGEIPGVADPEAISWGQEAAEVKLGKIGLKYAESGAQGIAEVPMRESSGRHAPGGKEPVPAGAGKEDRAVAPNNQVYVSNGFYDNHDLL